jgi:uncharacterized protein
LIDHTFTPAWFLRGPHAQTIWGRMTRRRLLVKFRRETLTTPDGDELVLDHLVAPVRNDRFRFVLLHGLEGSANSVYIQGMLSVIAKLGFNATAVNFRSCETLPRDASQSPSAPLSLRRDDRFRLRRPHPARP